MDLYRITREGFKNDQVSIGTRRNVAQTVGYVKQQNAIAKRFNYRWRLAVRIERVPVDGWVDVTAEFMGDQ